MRFRKVRIFHNRRSGPWYTHLSKIQAAMDESWAKDCEDIAWYFPASREQCLAMLEHAMDDGTDCVLASGGDGTVSSIGVRLLGTGIPLGVIPLGSGNGVARHFNQSLSPAKSVAQLAEGQIVDMDVGVINETPFLVSASIAWDAALVERYNQMPIRGIGSYFLAAAVSFLDYSPQPLTVTVDGAETITVERPLVFTIGNLSGWGGGARIDRNAKADDGLLELVTGDQRDAPYMLSALDEVFFNGGCKDLPRVIYRKFSHLHIHRPNPQPIQLDGELMDCGTDIDISVRPRALRLLIPPEPLPGSTGDEPD